MVFLQIYICLSLLAIAKGEIELQASSNDATWSACSCDNPDWCGPIRKTAKNEVFIFVLSDVNWPLYDWSRVTTVVQFGAINDSLTCYAHSKGARSVVGANFGVDELTNATVRAEWVAQRVAIAKKHFLDGVNVDFESEIDKDDIVTRDAYTNLLLELKTAFWMKFQASQISVDFGWSPDCIDKRCYDYAAIAKIVDLVFVMSYDERSQIYGDCIAFANSALNTTIYGVERYLALGVSRRKLVLGVPWYGYNYPCVALDKDNTCSIRKVPFRGVECSDAAGREVDYAVIMKDMLPASTSGLLWHAQTHSPYFNWKDPKTGGMHQIWFDNPRSLTYKYKYAVSRGLLGVGMWQADAVDYSNTPSGRRRRKEMWQAIPYVKVA